MDQGREDGLRRRCSVREPPVRGGEESIPAGTRLLAPPPHALCRLISLSIMLSSSIHAVANGFESILEGLYGPRLRRHLSLFEDCEPEELTDWSMDEKCSLCNLQREAVSSTPTEELSSQGQFNTEKIECQAENYLNALFQKKEARYTDSCTVGIPRHSLWGSGRKPQSNTACCSCSSQPSCACHGHCSVGSLLLHCGLQAVAASCEPCVWHVLVS
ncbi:uncharacterized protein LOC118667020 isoform X7 [Myotis myotis]|nr:uncharacterized protein LOC118667020 isoform X7 [Myotis myotis]